MEFSTPEELTALYSAWGEMITWEVFGQISQRDLDDLKCVWFPSLNELYLRIRLQLIWKKFPREGNIKFLIDQRKDSVSCGLD